MKQVRTAICDVADLQPDICRVFLLGDSGKLCSVLLHDDEIYITGDLCPHQNSSLNGCPFVDGAILCSRHGYRFNPGTGDCLTLAGYGLPVYKSDLDHNSGTVFAYYWDFEDNL